MLRIAAGLADAAAHAAWDSAEIGRIWILGRAHSDHGGSPGAGQPGLRPLSLG